MSLADDIGAELGRRLVPKSEVAEPIGKLLSGALGKLDGLFSQLNGSSGMASLGRLLIPEGAGSERSAYDIAERLAACLPVEHALAAAGLSADKTAREAEQQIQQLRNPDTSSSSRRTDPDPGELVKQLVKALQDAGDPGKDSLRLWRTLHEMSADMTAVAAIGAPKWTNGDAQRILKEQIQKWIKNIRALGGLPTRTLAVAKEIEDELMFRFSVRLGVAAVISAGGAALYGSKEMMGDVEDLVLASPSGMGLGTAVHSRLQRDYRTRRAFDVIEQDDRVYGLGQNALIIGTPLKDAAMQPGRDELLALYIARQTLKVLNGPLPEGMTTTSKLARIAGWSMRDDNTNITEARIFEIKPVRGAWLGVVQEMYYRSAFNLWVAIFQDLDSLKAAIKKLTGKDIKNLLFAIEHLYAGTPADWPEVNTSRGGALSVYARGTDYTIMVTMVDVLPGLVLYWNFDLPVAAVKLMYDTLRDLFNKLANKVRRWVIEVYTWIIAIVIAAAAVLLLVEAGVVGVIEAVIAALSRLGPIAPPVLEGIRQFSLALTAAGTAWTVTPAADAIGGLYALRLVPKGDLPPNTMLVGMQIGFLKVEGIPVDAAKHLAAIVAGGFALVDFAVSRNVMA
jgi:hypothetical protein